MTLNQLACFVPLSYIKTANPAVFGVWGYYRCVQRPCQRMFHCVFNFLGENACGATKILTTLFHNFITPGPSISAKNLLWRHNCVFKLDVRGSVHHSTILTEKPNKMQHCIKILLFLILNEAQHVSGDTPPIIRCLKLHTQPLVLRKWKVVGRVIVGRLSGSVRYLTTSNNHTSDNLPRMQNQRLRVQF